MFSMQWHGYRFFASTLVVVIATGCAMQFDPVHEKYLDGLELQYAAKQRERAVLLRQIAAATDEATAASMRAQMAQLDAEVVVIATKLDIPISQPYAEEPVATAETMRLPVIPPESRHAFVVEAKKLLTYDFKDPASAQYRNTYVSDIGGTVLCGEVNGKNSYGAYIGFKRFYATTSPLVQTKIESAKGSFEFSNDWVRYCATRDAEIE